MKRIFLALLLIPFLLSGCEDRIIDLQARQYNLIGTWLTESRGAANPGGTSTWKVVEFTSGGLYREVEFQGYGDEWDSADTTGGGPESGFYGWITFADSVTYEMTESELIFSNDPGAWEIKWMETDRFKLKSGESLIYERL